MGLFLRLSSEKVARYDNYSFEKVASRVRYSFGKVASSAIIETVGGLFYA